MTKKRKNTQERRVGDYTKQVAQATGLTQKQVRGILMFAWGNICHMIRQGEEVRLVNFGRIWPDYETADRSKETRHTALV